MLGASEGGCRDAELVLPSFPTRKTSLALQFRPTGLLRNAPSLPVEVSLACSSRIGLRYPYDCLRALREQCPAGYPPLLIRGSSNQQAGSFILLREGGILPFLLEAPRPSASAKGKWDATRDLASVGAELRKPGEVAPLEAAAGGEQQGWEIGGVGWEGADASPAR